MSTRILARHLALALLACVALEGCDRRARECEALRKVTDAPAAADDGTGDAAQADRAVADLDAIATRTPGLATARADYRASLAAVAVTSRSLHDTLPPVMSAVAEAAGGAGLKIDVAAEEGPLKDRLGALARPCVETMFSGLENIFQKDAGASPPPAAKADCDKLGQIVTLALQPEPGRSVVAHASAVAAALEAVPLESPSLTEAARGLAAQLRRFEPALARGKMPAADLLAMSKKLVDALRAAQEAQATARERADAVQKACPSR